MAEVHERSAAYCGGLWLDGGWEDAGFKALLADSKKIRAVVRLRYG